MLLDDSEPALDRVDTVVQLRFVDLFKQLVCAPLTTLMAANSR